MARKQLGMIDDALLAQIDRAAAKAGLTRRAWVERATRAALDGFTAATAPGTTARGRTPKATHAKPDVQLVAERPPPRPGGNVEGSPPRWLRKEWRER